MPTSGSKPPDLSSLQPGTHLSPPTEETHGRVSNDGHTNGVSRSLTKAESGATAPTMTTATITDLADVDVLVPTHDTPVLPDARARGEPPVSSGEEAQRHNTHTGTAPASETDSVSLRHPFSHPSVGHSPDEEHIAVHLVQADSHETFHDGVERTDGSGEPADENEISSTPRCVQKHCPRLGVPLAALRDSARNLVARARGMTWRQIIFVVALVALVMVGNFMQILMLNFWLVNFPADGTPGNYTAFAVPGILFSLIFFFWCVGYILIKRPNLSFAKHRYGWTLLVSIGFCDTFNSWLATYAASYTSEVLQALFTNLSPLYAVFMSKWILKDPRRYWNPWIIAVFVLTITGILAASLYGIAKEGKHMEDGQWWILIFFASIPFRVLQNVIQSLYMIVYTKDESFTFWLRQRLALMATPADGKKKHRKSGKGKKKNGKTPSAAEGLIDDEDGMDDEGDADGAERVSRCGHSPRSRAASPVCKASSLRQASTISEDDDDDDDDDDEMSEIDIIDERTLAVHLLQEQADAHMVPMVLHAPPPSMSGSFARNPDVGGAVSNASIAHSLLPREPSHVLLGNGSDIHIHNVHGDRHTTTARSMSARSAAPSVASHGSGASATARPVTDEEASAQAAAAAAAEEVVGVRYHQGEDTIVKLMMLAGETVAQMCFTLALLPADALPWWGNSDSVANTWSNFLEGIICVFTMPMNFLFGFLYTLGFVFTYVGGAYLNHYSVALCSIVTQLSSPLTALVLVLVPSWNVMEGGDSPWFCSVIAIVFLSIAALLYVMWEEKTDEEKIEGERVLKMNKLHVSAFVEALDQVEVSIVSSDD